MLLKQIITIWSMVRIMYVTTTYAPKAVAKIAIANRTNATGNEVTVKFNKLL